MIRSLLERWSRERSPLAEPTWNTLALPGERPATRYPRLLRLDGAKGWIHGQYLLEDHPRLSANRFCLEPGCTLANTRALLQGEVPYQQADGRPARLLYEYRLSDRCHMGFVHPTPSEAVLERIYTSDYAYYREAGDHPGRASLDCIRLEHVFEHLVDPVPVLRELHRLLRPGGLLVMTFPSIYPWPRMKNLAASPFLGYLQIPIHLAHHSVESSTRLLSAAGFAGIRTRITRRKRFITVLARRPGAEVAEEGA